MPHPVNLLTQTLSHAQLTAVFTSHAPRPLLPPIDEQEQSAGKRFAGTIVKHEFATDSATIEIDLTAAYPPHAGAKRTRAAPDPAFYCRAFQKQREYDSTRRRTYFTA